jgi:CRISPR-associated protein Cas4
MGLVGRPDHLVESDGVMVPVEQKPRSHRLQPSHVFLVAAQCMLVEEVSGVRSPFGVVLSEGVRHQVACTPALERNVLTTMGQMRALLARGVEPGPPWIAPKCQACGFREVCWG